MINSRQIAVIKKDIKYVLSNKTMLTGLIVVPLVFTVVLPLIFILVIHFAPDQMDDIEQLIEILPEHMIFDDIGRTFLVFLLDYTMPIFFVLIPVLVSTIMAASSFVGEKEKRTLETLLYSPLSLAQIYQAKVWASFFLSTVVTFASFIIMIIVVETSIFLTSGSMILPGINWLFTMLVISPTVSLLAINLIVIGSAKAKTMEEAQQRSIIFILPLIVMIVGQFTGVMLINAWILLVAGVIFGAASYFMMKKSMRSFTYEKLLKY